MKKKLSKILIAVAMLSLVACDGGKDDKKEVLATPAGIPQGRVTVLGDQNNFCDIGPSSITCTQYGQQCVQPFTYTNLATMCQNVQAALNSFTTCGQAGLNAVLTQRCAGVVQNSPGQSGFPQNQLQPIVQQPLDPNFREIQCEFEAYRYNQRKYFSTQSGTGLMKTSLLVDGRISQSLDLRSSFLGFDIGQFGITKLNYSPANLKGSADTITLSTTGLNGEIKIVQSGFAGNEVRIDAQNDSGSMRLMVACKGLGNFKRIASAKSVTQYVCTGKSDLGYKNEDIEIALPYNSSISGTETELADGLTMTIQDERVQLTAAGVASDVTVQTSAFLKEKVQLTIKDLGSDVNVTCSPK